MTDKKIQYIEEHGSEFLELPELTEVQKVFTGTLGKSFSTKIMPLEQFDPVYAPVHCQLRTFKSEDGKDMVEMIYGSMLE